ncbi:MAG: hypothetical protein QW165_00045 [Candidatus Woesearchaeota archaeon]
MSRIRIGFDPCGGDPEGQESPLVRQIAALAKISKEYADSATFVVAGNTDEINKALEKHDHANNIEIVNESNVFSMDGKIEDYKNTPTTISKLAEMLASKDINVLFSNGNTTATVYYSATKCEMLGRGVRPTLCTRMPRTLDKFYFLSDAGAHKQARAQHLLFNALLAMAYSQHVQHTMHPRVGLLEGPLAENALSYMKKLDNFAGIITPQDIYRQGIDVVVTDGFNGNIYLKATEAAAQGTAERIKQSTKMQKLWASVAHLFGVKSILSPFFTPHTRRYEQLRTLSRHTYNLHGVDSILQVKNAIPYMENGYAGRAIGVLSNGEEDVKGNKFARELADVLRTAPINYIGFVEPDDILHGIARRNGNNTTITSVFTEKQTADLFINTIEASEKAFLEIVKPLFNLTDLLLRPEELRQKFLMLKEGILNPNHFNGVPVLGINGYAVVGHGKATQYGTEQGLRFAIKYAQSKFTEYAKERILRYTA